MVLACALPADLVSRKGHQQVGVISALFALVTHYVSLSLVAYIEKIMRVSTVCQGITRGIASRFDNVLLSAC
jgi:uncharacterized membrane protein (DUF485 family)